MGKKEEKKSEMPFDKPHGIKGRHGIIWWMTRKMVKLKSGEREVFYVFPKVEVNKPWAEALTKFGTGVFATGDAAREARTAWADMEWA